MTTAEKAGILLNNLYETIPDDLQAAVNAAGKFLNGGVERKTDENGDDIGVGSGLRLYSFEKDANLIFSAFRQTHGIDLSKEVLHWWTFLSLFMDLGADTAFCNLVALRKRFKTGKATKEEKAAAYEMGDMFDIPDLDTRTLEEREAEAVFWEKVNRGKST